MWNTFVSPACRMIQCWMAYALWLAWNHLEFQSQTELWCKNWWSLCLYPVMLAILLENRDDLSTRKQRWLITARPLATRGVDWAPCEWLLIKTKSFCFLTSIADYWPIWCLPGACACTHYVNMPDWCDQWRHGAMSIYIGYIWCFLPM